MTARLTIFLVFFSTMAVGQVQDDWDIQAENFLNRIKNIEFFIDRFNSQGTDTLQRNYQIISLFDLTKLKAKNSVSYRETAAAFIRSVNRRDHQVLLNFTDTSWYAELSVKTKSSGLLTCLLQVTPQPSGHAWSVVAITLDGRETERFGPNDIIFPPNANGTDFMSVLIAFRDGKVPAVNKMNVRAEMIQRITYHFLQVDGWIFTVDYVDRNSKNSGWLVNELVKTTGDGKINYRRKLHLD
ncbi:MAG TPA: hypothetical protein VFE50_22990 [Cyclobacteriaceae bacterium]|nr:hypothetical protein [Cyclobacteriaceae bacterium]